MTTPIWRPLLGVAILGLPGGAIPDAAAQGTAVRVVSGVAPDGRATERWLEIVRRRLPERSHDSVASIRKPLTAGERAWEELIRARSVAWGDEALAVARPYRPVEPPRSILVLTGNRGAEDAFTHDSTTIGFDLAALQANYGTADLAENSARLDRFFRHEYAHVMQKAWWAVHPYPTDTPLRHALAEIWSEGLGNYHSLSTRWRREDGRRSPTAAAALTELEPRFVAR
ncbi:MAG TPA: hypothetical protein VJ773_07115, partial [Gemmatimonadales bacterium]|nr:hypothetical protein [Gemmatimonadales bacterium]